MDDLMALYADCDLYLGFVLGVVVSGFIFMIRDIWYTVRWKVRKWFRLFSLKHK